jgi:hypothetical protein
MDAQDFRSLQEAYMEVVENQQLDEASRADDTTRANIARYAGKKGISFEPGPNWDPSANRGKGAHLSPKQKEKQRRKALRSEEVDIYDIILSHLLDEGYAETPEAAEAIMVNMSEEWREGILEEVEQLDEISLKTKMSAYARSQDPDADYNYGSKVHAQGDRIKKAIVKKHGENAGKHAERHADAEHWGRKDASGKSKGLPKPRIQKNRDYRTTKAGKMHGQDQSKLKRDLKYNRFVED